MPLMTARARHEVLFRCLLTNPARPRMIWCRHTGNPAGILPGDFETFWRTSVHDGLWSPTLSRLPSSSALKGWISAGSGRSANGVESLIPAPTPNHLRTEALSTTHGCKRRPKPLSRNTWDKRCHDQPQNGARLEAGPAWRSERSPVGTRRGFLRLFSRWPGKWKFHTGPQPGPSPIMQSTLFLRLWPDEDRAVWNRSRLQRLQGTPQQFRSNIGQRRQDHVTNRYWDIAVTQGHFSNGRSRTGQVANLKNLLRTRISLMEHPEEEPKTTATNRNRSTPISRRKENFYPEICLGAMSIDLEFRVSGCQACAVCVPGREQHLCLSAKSRCSVAVRCSGSAIDSYYEGDPANPQRSTFQRCPCMQCENAPCEPGLPGWAHHHSLRPE